MFKFDSHFERKRFVIFNTCTLAAVFPAVILIVLTVNLFGANIYPFGEDLVFVLLACVITWCSIGSHRFVDKDCEGDRIDRFFYRSTWLLFSIAFPFIYFYNLAMIISGPSTKIDY